MFVMNLVMGIRALLINVSKAPKFECMWWLLEV